jgi:hypothetical protein
MTWKTLTDLLAREFRNLRRMPVVSFGFASAPVTSASELIFLRERIRFAYEYASLAEISVARPILIAGRPEIWNEQRRLLEWLLIDVWRNSGVINWIEPFVLLTESSATIEAPWHLHVSE